MPSIVPGVATSGSSPFVTDAEASATYAQPAVTVADIVEPWVLYHRGLSGQVPENTFEAFDAALACGAQAIETDFWLTLDGSLACVHDETLTRTTTSTGDVADLTAGQIVSLVEDLGATVGGAWTSRTLRVPTFRK